MDKRRIIKSWIFILVITLAITFFQLPYYVSTPGMAKTLAPIIEVEGGYEDEEGSFMLTTVRIGKANIIQYLWAKTSDYHKIYSEEDLRLHGESDEEYHQRQLHMMDTSKDSAAYVAYKHAGKKADMNSNGVYVEWVFEDMPADGKLMVADRIYSVDDIVVQDAEDLIQYVGTKKENDVVKVKLERDGEEVTVDITLRQFPGQEEKVGMGIQLVTDREIILEPELSIATDEIGGPSAGLMFSLEIYNQLVKKDITKGYQIAGSGTINYQGEVGPIGGIKQKIAAAHKAGADIFFAPNEKGREGSNYADAMIAAEDLETKMEIVPVDTFDDAITYLQKIESKPKEK